MLGRALDETRASFNSFLEHFRALFRRHCVPARYIHLTSFPGILSYWHTVPYTWYICSLSRASTFSLDARRGDFKTDFLYTEERKKKKETLCRHCLQIFFFDDANLYFILFNLVLIEGFLFLIRIWYIYTCNWTIIYIVDYYRGMCN